MIVEILDAANSDLEYIADHIAQDNLERALSFVRELRAKCRDLVDFPRAYSLVEQFASRGVRRRRHGRYLIFFVVEPERIAVIRILHASRDYAAILDS